VHRIKSTGLAGYSFGGSAIIQAAIASPNIVTTIVSLATQSYGASEAISKLDQRPSTLLIHGNDDKGLSFYCLKQA
jgi:alpha/beta superfamily hydrolase